MAKILFLAHRVPYPPNKGEKIRAFNELEHLAKHHQIWLGAGADDPTDLEYLEDCRRRFRGAYFGMVGHLQTFVNLAGATLTGAPLSVARFYHPGLARWCSDVLTKIEPDLVFVFSSAAAQFVLGRMRGRTRLVTDFVDADAEKWRAYAETSRGAKRRLYEAEFRRLVDYETKVTAGSATSLFVSQTERDLFTRLVPGAASHARVVPNGVDTTFFQPDIARGEPLPNSIVFMGTMDYRPNVDAVTWFARDILPLIRRAVPSARFRIVGAKPAPTVQALSALEGVEVIGGVPDVRPYVQQATVVVAPLRIARGIQNKVLEGMAMARPIVTTPEALDGITARPGRDLLVAENPTDFAAKVITILEGRMSDNLGANARAAAIAHHGWGHHLEELDDIIKRAMDVSG